MAEWGQPWGLLWGSPNVSPTHSLSLSGNATAVVIPAGLLLKELKDSRQLEEDGNGRRLTRVFAIHGTSDPVKVSGVGPQRGDIYDASVGSDETGTDDRLIVSNRSVRILSLGEVAVELTVFYEEVNLSINGIGRQVSLNITGRSKKIQQGFETVHFPTGDAGDLEEEWGDTIGPRTKGGELQGVERIDTAMDYSVTDYRSILTVSYVNTLLGLHTRVNNASFHGFNQKNVLFQGVRATRSGNGLWQLVYAFIVNPIRVVREYDNFISADGEDAPAQTIDIQGFEYLWFEHAEKKAEVGGKAILTKKLRSAHIATIYEEGNFGGLGLGTGPIYNNPPLFEI